MYLYIERDIWILLGVTNLNPILVFARPTCLLSGSFLSSGKGCTPIARVASVILSLPRSHLPCPFFTLGIWPSCPRWCFVCILCSCCGIRCFSLLRSDTATGDCGTTAMVRLCSLCLSSWKCHINTCLFLLPVALLNSFSCQLHFILKQYCNCCFK